MEIFGYCMAGFLIGASIRAYVINPLLKRRKKCTPESSCRALITHNTSS